MASIGFRLESEVTERFSVSIDHI